MPIPGDNGNPQKERDAQNKRIIDVAEHGACVRRELKVISKDPNPNLFGSKAEWN